MKSSLTNSNNSSFEKTYVFAILSILFYFPEAQSSTFDVKDRVFVKIHLAVLYFEKSGRRLQKAGSRNYALCSISQQSKNAHAPVKDARKNTFALPFFQMK